MEYGNITAMECMEYYRQGWAAILHNGKVIGFKKKGASFIKKCANELTVSCNYSRQRKESQYE